MNLAKKQLLSPKSDFIFKLIFGDERRKHLLADFLLSILDFPKEELDHIQITDPHLKKELSDDKFAILDVKLFTKNKDIIDIEIQLLAVPYLKDRVIYYNSKMVTEQLKRGDTHYLKRVISIIIVDFDLIPDSKHYHSKFQLYDKNLAIEFTNLIEINVLELNKMPKQTDHTELWNWLKFLNVKTKEELDMIAKENPNIEKAGSVLLELSQDEQTRLLEDAREKARLDYVWSKQYYLQQGRDEGIKMKTIEIAKELINEGFSLEQISKITKMSADKILGL